MNDVQTLLDDVKKLSEKAGEAILRVYQTDFEVENKHDNTPLTKADLAAHNIIVEGLTKLTPDIPVLSEESAYVDFNIRKNWIQYWLVDPLDGTREFIRRNGEFTVNIAFIDNQMPILGVIYTPISGLTYYAVRGQGAFKQEKGGKPIAIKTRAMNEESFKVAGSRSHAGPGLREFLTSFDQYDMINMGSSLKSCLVAEGTADIYPRFGPTSEWDTAAAQCIVEEAGGEILGLSMKPLRYNTKASLLNPHFVVVGDASYDWQSCMPKESS